MPLTPWLSCPAGCGSDVQVVITDGQLVGLRCRKCGARAESPVPLVEPQYRSVGNATGC